MNDELVAYAVYENPRDYPGKFVVRRWVGLKPDSDCTVHETLEEAHASLPAGLHCIDERSFGDPVVREVWI